MSVRYFTIALVILVATCPAMDARVEDPPEIPPTIADAVKKHTSVDRADEPGAAAEHYLMKRQGPSTDFDRIRALRDARVHTEGMPIHSIALRGPIADFSRSAGPLLPFLGIMRVLGAWDPLGPGNIGGRTRTLVIHPSNPEIMYTGGVSGGVWKTTDGGDLWQPMADDLSNIAINSMAMHPTDPDVLYVGTGEGYFREEVRGTWLPLRGAGVFMTDDGGATWHHLPATDTPDFQWVNDMATSPRFPDRLYAATRSGVWISEDRGASWSNILAATEKGGCLDLALRTDHPNDWLFAACGTLDQATVYRRVMRPGGEWEEVLSEPGMGRTTLAIAPTSQNIIYALSASNDSGPDGNYEQGLFAVHRSVSGGNPGSWQKTVDNTDPIKLHTLLLSNPAAASYLDCGWYYENRWVNMGWYANVIAVDPVDPDVVWAAGVDLFRSDDGGQTWGLASYWWMDRGTDQFVHADQHVVSFHPDYDGSANRTVLVANDGGVFITNDSHAPVARGPNAVCDPDESQMRWQSLNHNLGITQFYHGAVFPGAERFIGGTQDNGTLLRTEGAGHDQWLHVIGGDGGYVAIDPSDTRTVYAETQRFNFRKSLDGGYSFDSALNGVTDESSDFLFITPFAMDTSDPQILWSGGRRLWRTTNGASRWYPASTRFDNSAMMSAVAVHPNDSQTVMIGTTTGSIHRSEMALEAGSTTVWPAARPRDGFVSWLAFDPQSPEIVYATYAGFGGDHVWRSFDGGLGWEPLDGSGTTGLPDVPVHSLVVDPHDSRILYIGTDIGVFTSVDGGRNWAVENTGFANAVTESLTLGTDDDGGRWLFAFTHGRGAWRVPLRPIPPPPRTPGGRVSP